MGNTMQRRQFLRSLSATRKQPISSTVEKQTSFINPASSLFKASGVQSGISPYAGAWTETEMLHLLRRLTFGAPKSSVEQIKTMSVGAAVDFLIDNPVQPATTPVNNYTQGVDSGGVAFGASWTDAGLPNPVDPPAPAAAVLQPLISNRTNNSFKPWWMGQMINQQTHILEKITLFWANHFGTDTINHNRPKSIYQHHKMLRASALGNFRDLIKKVTVDAHMLHFLNGELSSKAAPNENYGRELQELFTVGKGPGSLYSEGDVKAAARVLTGWQIPVNTATATYPPVFTASRHDTADKVFSDFYNNKVIKGQTGANGALETDELLDMILQTTECARYIVRRLYVWFVYYDITPDIETNVIIPLADIFRNSGYDIPTVLKALFKSEHFFDPQLRGGIIKSPIDLYVGLVREFKITLAAAPLDIQYAHLKNFCDRCANASEAQNIGDPPNVAGWPAYYNQPSKFYETWMSGASIQLKAKNIKAFSSKAGITVSGVKLQIDPIAFNKQFSNPGNPNAVVADFIFYLLPFDLTAEQKATMKSILLNNQATDSYWTSAWNDYMANPTNPTAMGLVQTRLYDLLTYLTALPEFYLY
jgi:uncharacterized protein (DUF1800 family)